MNILKPLIISTSLLAASFSTFAYHGDGYGNNNGSWHRGGYQNQQQYNNRPCDNYRRHHQGMMQYSTSIQTSQPEEALKKIVADVPKGENGKQYMVKVAVVEITPNTPVQAQ